MPKEQPKEKAPRAMTDALRVKRGRALDEMQQRIAAIKQNGKVPPAEWQAKMHSLAESSDADQVEKELEWMAASLPPKEYGVEEITWQTFNHFSGALLDRITLYAMRQQLLGGSVTPAVEIMQLITAIKTATDSPVVAMTELAKARAGAVKNLDGFEEQA